MSTRRRAAKQSSDSGKGQANGLRAYLTVPKMNQGGTKRAGGQEGTKQGSPDPKSGVKAAGRDSLVQGRGGSGLGRGNIIPGRGQSPLNFKQSSRTPGVDVRGPGEVTRFSDQGVVTPEDEQARESLSPTNPQEEGRNNKDTTTEITNGQTDLKLDWDLREHIKALPTKNDIMQLISAVEASCKQAVEEIREEVGALGHRVEEWEMDQEDTRQAVVDLQEITKKHEEVLNSMLDQMDNYENRERRQNIRIRGLPEIEQRNELQLLVIRLFRLIMGTSAPEMIEIDRVHRALFPAPQGTERPRDVICKMHRYQVKEAIMRAAREGAGIEFEGGQIALFPDLSRRTLMQRRTIKPLLEALRAVDVRYRWGYPFKITATRNGRTASLQNKDDLQHFIDVLELPQVDFPDWRFKNQGTVMQSPGRWQQVPVGDK